MTLPSCIVQKIPLPRPLPSVLGVGAYLKNALCLVQGNEAWVSRENGSLDCVDAVTQFRQTAQDLIEAAFIKPVAVAHDWHPDFPCTRWAVDYAVSSKDSSFRTDLFRRDPKPGSLSDHAMIQAIGIQHHHAHVAAVMAEHGIDGPTLGLALDGFGLGTNNEAWGGELLRVDACGFSRLGHLRTMPQPGGDIAARQPWRMGAAALWSLGRGADIAATYHAQVGAPMLATMMDRGLNAPMTSSAGRLFDAACGLLHVIPVASFEGEAPMKLESMVTEPVVNPSGWRIDGNMVLDLGPLLSALIGKEAQAGANVFHGTLVAALLDWAQKASAQTGIKQIALCGGCFLNKVLREGLVQGMIEKGLTPLLPKQMVVGDTAIALGQAYAAAMSRSR